MIAELRSFRFVPPLLAYLAFLPAVGLLPYLVRPTATAARDRKSVV